MKTPLHEPISIRRLVNLALIELQKHNKVTVGNAALALFDTLVDTHGYKENALETEIDSWMGIALALAHKHQWHPIVTCPLDEMVLLWTEHDSYRAVIGQCCSRTSRWLSVEHMDGDEMLEPTHWSPLPVGPNPASLDEPKHDEPDLYEVLLAAPSPMDTRYQVGERLDIKAFMIDYGAWSRKREGALIKAEMKP
jgi:hypothetical protein